MTEEEQIKSVLDSIQRAANLRFGHKLFRDFGPDEDIMKGFDAIINSDLPKWKRDYYAVMRKDFDKTENRIDEEVLKKQEKYIQNKIKKAVKDGLLPKNYDPKNTSDASK